VIYPPSFLAHLKRQGSGFLDCCPKADDLWLHVQAIRAGYRVRQISTRAKRFHEVPGSGAIALWNHNGSGGNDAQIRATYTEDDVRILREERGYQQSWPAAPKVILQDQSF
jgi:hypothetical protein